MERLISVLGLFTMVFLAWLMSAHKRRMNWRVIAGGMLLQFGFALLVLKTSQGRAFFDGVGKVFNSLIDCVGAGTSFLFNMGLENQESQGRTLQLITSFAFGVLPTIVFFSALMSILYYIGIMQWVVAAVAWVMQRTLRTSGAETLSASANIFVGQTEAPLVIKPYVAGMTQSELMAVMVGGFATVAGGVMAAYVNMGVSAGHLVTASVISAPAALLIAKILQPEVEEPLTAGKLDVRSEQTAINLIDAAATGAADGLKLALNVGAMLIAFIALIAMFDGILGWAGGIIGGWFGEEWSWSLRSLLGYLFYPLAWLMGIEADQCLPAGKLLGLRLASNEFVAFQELGDWMKPNSGVLLTDRTKVILTYALCGFANFSSIGIQIGGIGGIAPQRRHDLARLGMRAMLGGLLACSMTACVAGILNPAWRPVNEAPPARPVDDPTTPKVPPDERAPVNLNDGRNVSPNVSSLLQLKLSRQQLGQISFDNRIWPVGVNEKNWQRRGEFGQHLAAGAARHVAAGGGNGDGEKFPLAGGNSGKDGGALRANG